MTGIATPAGMAEPDDLARRLARLTAADSDAARAAAARQARLTKPAGSLGRLEGLAVWLAGWQGREKPCLDIAQAIVFAGNHGVVRHGISPFPADVTVQMVANFEAGGAAINQICEAFGIALTVTALDLDRPTGDITCEPAMSAAECLAAINAGMSSVRADADVIVVGEMGIGNTTVAATLAAAAHGGAGADWVGAGTGLDARGIAHKARIVDMALARHGSQAGQSAFEMLRLLGGREQAAIAGAVLAARERRIPVILDGFVCTAAAGVLARFVPGMLDHCVCGHVSAERGHRRLAEALGLDALLDLGMRLGEGSGAAVAYALLKAAVAAHNGMATFGEAGVAERD